MPRSSFMPPSLLRRSRSRISASLDIRGERRAAEAGPASIAAPSVARWRRGVRSGSSTRQVRSRPGSFSRVVCETTRGPANDISAPGSASTTSPRLAKLASTPPVVGCVSTESIAPPESCSSSIAQIVFGSCMSARIPSCIRAPPDAEMATSGTPGLRRPFTRAHELLPDHAAHRAAHEREVHDGEIACILLDRRRTADDRVAEPGLDLGLRESLGVRAKVEEPERIGRAELGVALDERPWVGQLLDSLPRADPEVMAALRAHAERLRRARRRDSASRSPGRCSDEPCPDAGSSGRLFSTSTSTRPCPEDMRWILVPGVSEASRGSIRRRECSVPIGCEEPRHADPRDRRPLRDVP